MRTYNYLSREIQKGVNVAHEPACYCEICRMTGGESAKDCCPCCGERRDLLAAAKAALKVLEEVAKLGGGFGQDAPLLVKLRAAITAAEGGLA